MPFVCVGSMGAVITIAFFRESHHNYLQFYLQDNTGREVCLWGVQRRRGGSDPAGGGRAEVRTAVSL